MLNPRPAQKFTFSLLDFQQTFCYTIIVERERVRDYCESEIGHKQL